LTWQRQFRENWSGLHEFDCLATDCAQQLERCVRGWLANHDQPADTTHRD